MWLILVWLGLGALGTIVISTRPGKVAFERSFYGSLSRLIVGFLIVFSWVLGPVWLVIAFLLPERNTCSECLSTYRRGLDRCPECGSTGVSQAKGSRAFTELLNIAPQRRYSHAVRQAILQGQRVIGGPPTVATLGLIAVVCILSVFVLPVWDGGIWLAAVGGTSLILFGVIWTVYRTPKWREWAIRQPGVDGDELQKAGEEALLLWPAKRVTAKDDQRA